MTTETLDAADEKLRQMGHTEIKLDWLQKIAKELQACQTLGLKITRLWNNQADWAPKVFGTGSEAAKRALAHMREEIGEIEAAPTDVFEYADFLLLLLHTAQCNGVSLDGIIDAAVTKNERNRNAKWHMTELGYFKRVK